MKKKLSSKEKFEKEMQDYKDEVKSFAEPDVSKSELNEITENIPSSFDQLIQRELVKFDVVVPAVNELAKEFLPLKIQSVDDKEGYSEVTKALRFIVSKRTAVEDKRKELKADSLAYGRAVDARAKEITALLEPIESHLKDEKNRIDTVIERLKAEEEEKKQKGINDRIAILIGLGMYQTINEFVWKSRLNPDDEETFLRVNLELFSEEDFNEFVSSLTEKVTREKEIFTYREAEQKAEAERIEKMKKELEEEKERVANEMQEMKQQRAVARNEALANLGLGTVSFNPNWVFMKKANGISIVNMVHQDDVLNMSADEWKGKFEEVKSEYERLKAEEQKAEAINEAIIKEKLIKEQEQKAAAIIVGAEVAEKERKDNMSDKELYIDYLERLKDVPVPELKTKKWQNYILTITKAIDNFKNIN
jgi:hypothetical protein